MSHSESLEEVTENTELWMPNLNLRVPINGADIKGFKQWINLKGFSPEHPSYDFVAYAKEDGQVVVGLPDLTEVIAVADGIVKETDYASMTPTMVIEHGREGSGLISCYTYVERSVRIEHQVKKGQQVKKEDGIGMLKQYGKVKIPILLHFSLYNKVSGEKTPVDPSKIFSGLDHRIEKELKW